MLHQQLQQQEESTGMASSKQVLLLAAVACLASLASATQWVVGDEEECGWKAKFNQTGWANGKTFVVGDTLLFKYIKEEHNVVQVGEEDFATCGQDENHFTWCSGHDVLRLDKPGRMWFICTKDNHCREGMNLAIDVVDRSTVVVDPPPPPELPSPFAPPPFGWPCPATAPPPPLFTWPSTPPRHPPPYGWPWTPARPPPPYGWPWNPPPPPPQFGWPWIPPPPTSATVRNQVGSAVAAVVVAALAF